MCRVIINVILSRNFSLPERLGLRVANNSLGLTGDDQFGSRHTDLHDRGVQLEIPSDLRTLAVLVAIAFQMTLRARI